MPFSQPSSFTMYGGQPHKLKSLKYSIKSNLMQTTRENTQYSKVEFTECTGSHCSKAEKENKTSTGDEVGSVSSKFKDA